ncbi:MAG: glycosyltransferase [Cytophagales bacterium]|nr:MAG: glycosyltransferase [Cytophagales bacterium]
MSAYNAEKYIAIAIESVLAQTFQDFEFIIVDDGSKDNTLAIAKHYQAQDTRIVIDSHENMGLGNSLNRGMGMAKGEWIARMDADDIMLPHRLEEQVKYLRQHPEVGVLSCWAYYIGHQGKIIGKLKSPTDLNNPQDSQRYLEQNKVIYILHPGTIMKKEVVLRIGGYKPIAPSQDIDLWNRLVEHGVVIICTNQILMQYRIHEDSITTSQHINSLNYIEWIGTCMKLRRQAKAEISFDTFQQQIAAKPFWVQMNRTRKLYSNYLYRNAAFQYGNDNYLLFVASLIGSFFLDPKRIIRKMLAQI